MNKSIRKRNIASSIAILSALSCSVSIYDCTYAKNTQKAESEKSLPNGKEVASEKSADQPASVIPSTRPDAGWMDKHNKLVAKVHSTHPDIAFFGDSITEGMNLDLMHKIISPKANSYGLSGDRTQHLLWRMRNGELDFSAPGPEAFVVLIGTNNISSWPGYPSSTNEEIFKGVQADLNEMHSRYPEAKILLLAMLPRDQNPDTPIRKRVNETNELLKKLADDKHIFYADINSALLEKNGKISAKVMPDFLHPSAEEGYKLMFTAIKPHLDQMLATGKK